MLKLLSLKFNYHAGRNYYITHPSLVIAFAKVIMRIPGQLMRSTELELYTFFHLLLNSLRRSEITLYFIMVLKGIFILIYLES